MVFTVPVVVFSSPVFTFFVLLLGVLLVYWVFKFIASIIVGG